jgi:SSS family solute:Na+ symporter
MGAVVPQGQDPEKYYRVVSAIYLGQNMPMVIKGFALAGMIAAFVSTVDSYFLAWASIVVNDIICPMRKKTMSPKQHIWTLRLTIALIAVFLYFFGVLYTPSESILAYITVTGAMFLGVGIIMIGGLYWKRSTTPAAYVSVLICCIIPMIDLIAKQVLRADYPLKGPHSSFIGIVCGLVFFVVISMVTKRNDKAIGRF